jgi:hypothetical protein
MAFNTSGRDGEAFRVNGYYLHSKKPGDNDFVVFCEPSYSHTASNEIKIQLHISSRQPDTLADRLSRLSTADKLEHVDSHHYPSVRTACRKHGKNCPLTVEIEALENSLSNYQSEEEHKITQDHLQAFHSLRQEKGTHQCKLFGKHCCLLLSEFDRGFYHTTTTTSRAARLARPQAKAADGKSNTKTLSLVGGGGKVAKKKASVPDLAAAAAAAAASASSSSKKARSLLLAASKSKRKKPTAAAAAGIKNGGGSNNDDDDDGGDDDDDDGQGDANNISNQKKKGRAAGKKTRAAASKAKDGKTAAAKRGAVNAAKAAGGKRRRRATVHLLCGDEGGAAAGRDATAAPARGQQHRVDTFNSYEPISPPLPQSALAGFCDDAEMVLPGQGTSGVPKTGVDPSDGRRADEEGGRLSGGDDDDGLLGGL